MNPTYNKNRKKAYFNNREYFFCHGYYRTSDEHPHWLHRDVWEYNSKRKIPKGYHVHHINGNTFDNRFSNLTCLSPEAHKQAHDRMTQRKEPRLRRLKGTWRK